MEFRNIVKGLLISSINASLKDGGKTKIIFPIDDIGKAAGYKDGKSEAARAEIQRALQKILSICISYDDGRLRIIEGYSLNENECQINLSKSIVSLFRFIEV